MRHKKLVSMVLAIFVLGTIFLTGCSNKEGASSGDKPIKIKIAGQYPVEHPGTKTLNEFKARVEKETDGRIQVSVYPANQLGDYTVVYEEIMKGTIDMALITIPSNYDPRLELLYVHSVAENYDQAKKLYAPGSFVYNTLAQVHEELGVKFLGLNVEGFGGLGLTKMPTNLTDPTAKKNILLRVPPIDVFRQWAEDMNFTTVSVPYAELYTALQTGVADGWSGGPPVANYNGFRDVIKYYVQVNNYFENTSWVMNHELFKSLTPEDQKTVSTIVADLAARSIDEAEQIDNECMAEMEKVGIEVVRLSDEEIHTLAEHTRKTTWPKLEKLLGKEIVDGLMAQYETK
ncbi:TRAP transporter substrate-binding protein DctP [Desulfotomaculum sp. 1211_IL3151]|uniref:TRAP transporter substrate-binding protein DctP n=1 Tax=Desulfotomaculum sp. 1211_IL3151 TaxID=3084055 RepID=UPI002FD9C9D5